MESMILFHDVSDTNFLYTARCEGALTRAAGVMPMRGTQPMSPHAYNIVPALFCTTNDV